MKIWQLFISMPQIIERGPRELRAVAGPGWMALVSRLGAEPHRLWTPKGQLWGYREGPTQPLSSSTIIWFRYRCSEWDLVGNTRSITKNKVENLWARTCHWQALKQVMPISPSLGEAPCGPLVWIVTKLKGLTPWGALFKNKKRLSQAVLLTCSKWRSQGLYIRSSASPHRGFAMIECTLWSIVC